MLAEHELLRRVTLHVAAIAGRPSETVQPSASLAAFDIDSVDAIEMAMRMERELGCEVDPELFLRSDATIEALAEALYAAQVEARRETS